jgi:hypothetical protein
MGRRHIHTPRREELEDSKEKYVVPTFRSAKDASQTKTISCRGDLGAELLAKLPTQCILRPLVEIDATTRRPTIMLASVRVESVAYKQATVAAEHANSDRTNTGRRHSVSSITAFPSAFLDESASASLRPLRPISKRAG